MSAISISRLLPAGSLAWGLQGAAVRSASMLVHHQSCAPSASGRVQEPDMHFMWVHSYATAHGSGALKAGSTPSSSATAVSMAAGSNNPTAQTTASSRAPNGNGGGDGSAPFYAGLAARYPDPDTVPDAVVHRLRNLLFGRAVRPREATGRRALARPLQGKVLTDWYWMPPNESPGFHSEEDEYELRRALNRRHIKEVEAEAADAGTNKKKKK